MTAIKVGTSSKPLIMEWFLKCYILINIKYILVESLIENLNVRKVDKKVIARKRQDTLDMCRLFTEGTEKIDKIQYHSDPNNLFNENTVKRMKRDIVTPNFAINPALNEDDAKRVETIVEKLYDDIEDKGVNTTYRHQIISTTTVMVTKKQNNSRRFNFAPAELLGPLPSKQLIHEPNDEPTVGNARWTHGIVPYYIDSRTYDADLAEIIMKAFDYFEKATCVRLQRLRERPTDKESLKNIGWLYITNPAGIRQCVHSNERRKTTGVQLTVFGYDCMSPGDIAHEVMHVLGFSHEHTRSDRDQYITILWDNIKPGYKKYFDMGKNEYQNIVESLPYDYASVLHYPARAFSKNGQVTVMTEPGIKIGQREALSEIDVEKVGLVYSNECVKRNREYLLKTCPSVVRADTNKKNVTQQEIEDYFRNRLWPFGIVNYKLRDKMEFSVEERENIKAVMRHIEKETCIEFRDITLEADETDIPSDNDGIVLGNKNSSDDIVVVNKGSSSDIGNNVEPHNYLTDNPSENEIKITEDENINKIKLETNVRSDQEEVVTDLDKPESTSELKNVGQVEESVVLSDKNEDIKGVQSVASEQTRVRRALRLPERTYAPQAARTQQTTPLSQKEYTPQPTRTPQKANLSQRAQTQQSGRKPQPPRRHAGSILVLARSSEPGCICPPPGRPEGDKVLQINTDCFNSVNDLLHVFVHILGLDHQHNMHDRDSYLYIVWEKLTSDVKEDMKQKLPPAASVGFPYDYQSVMHYPWLQIKNGVTNIMYPIWNDGWAMGHWQGLSSTDVQKLNLLYFNQCVAKKKQNASIKYKFK